MSDGLGHYDDTELTAELERRRIERKLAQIPQTLKGDFDWSAVEGLARHRMRHLALRGSRTYELYGSIPINQHDGFYAEIAREVVRAMYGQEGYEWMLRQ